MRLSLTASTTFQFHIGSIKSAQIAQQMNCYVEFQFHIGSIKRSKFLRFITKKPKFQFHIGSIKSDAKSLGTAGSKFISIPHWFN